MPSPQHVSRGTFQPCPRPTTNLLRSADKSQLLPVPPERILRAKNVGGCLGGKWTRGRMPSAKGLPEGRSGGQQRGCPGVQRSVDPRRRSLERHVRPVEGAPGEKHVADERLDGRLAHEPDEKELFDDLRADRP